jgi:hypothetical protein
MAIVPGQEVKRYRLLPQKLVIYRVCEPVPHGVGSSSDQRLKSYHGTELGKLRSVSARVRYAD